MKTASHPVACVWRTTKDTKVTKERTERSLMRRHLLHIALVIALALGLRLYHLGHQNLWIDETWQVRIASQPAAEIIRNYRPDTDRRLRDQAPLSLLVTHLFLSADRSEWNLRFPAAVFGTLTVIALLLLAREFFPYPTPAIAALFLSLSPLHIWYSQDARWYAQWLCLLVFSYVAFVRAWKADRFPAWLSYAVLTLLAIYTFVFSFLAIACQAVSALWLQRVSPERPRFLRKFILVHLVVTAAAAPVLWVNLSQTGISTGTPRPTNPAALGYTAFTYAAGLSLGPTLAYLHSLPAVSRVLLDHPVVVIVFAIFAPLLIFGLVRIWRLPAAAAVMVPWLAGPPLLIFLIARLTHVIYEVRYTIIALPAFLLLLALGVDALKPAAVRRGAIAAVLACFALSLANHYWNPSYGKEDVRGALAHVTATEFGQTAAPVVTVGQIETVAPYYGRGLDLVSPRNCGDGTESPGHLATLRDFPALWLLVGRDWDQQGEHCLAALLRSHVVLERRRFAGVDLWHLGRRDQEKEVDDRVSSQVMRPTEPR